MTARAVAVAAVTATVVLSVVLSAYALAELDAVDLAGFLARHHAVPYATGLWWVVLAPVPLLGAAVSVGRTPWPWVVVCTLHLAVLLAVTTRLRHVVPGLATTGVAVVVVLGVASVVACAARRPMP